MDEFEISATSHAGCQIITLRGDLDGDTAPGLDAALAGCSPQEPVIVDLSRLDMLTSAGVQSLLRERGWGLPALVCPDGRIATTLEIVQAHRVVPIYRALDAAIAALSQQGRRRRLA